MNARAESVIAISDCVRRSFGSFFIEAYMASLGVSIGIVRVALQSIICVVSEALAGETRNRARTSLAIADRIQSIADAAARACTSGDVLVRRAVEGIVGVANRAV